MQTSTGWLQDILESVSLQEIYAFPCSLLSFVLCMDFYWNSSVRTKTAGAAEVIYKKMCMLLTSHTHTAKHTLRDEINHEVIREATAVAAAPKRVLDK